MPHHWAFPPTNQAFYFDQKAIMSNEEFDNLKEELMWEGSSVVMLSKHICLFAPLLTACAQVFAQKIGVASIQITTFLCAVSRRRWAKAFGSFHGLCRWQPHHVWCWIRRTENQIKGLASPSILCTCKDIHTHFMSMFSDQVLCYAVRSPSLDRRQCYCDGGSQVQSKES